MEETATTVARSVRLRGIAAAVAAACGVTACSGGGGATTPTRRPPVTTVALGFLGPLSGIDAATGAAIKNGEELAVNEYMQTHPKVGVTVDVVDAHAQAGTAGADHLVRDHVVAVVGPAQSKEVTASAPRLDHAAIPMLSTSATAVGLAQQGWRYFHRLVPDVAVQGAANADYLAKQVGDTTVGVVDDGGSFGMGVAGAFATELGVDGGRTAYTAQLTASPTSAMAAAGHLLALAPAGVFYAGEAAPGAALLGQLRADGYAGTFLAAGQRSSQQLVSDAGTTASEGALLSCVCRDPNRVPGAVVFDSAYQAAYGTAPGFAAASAYDATNELLAAIRASDVTGAAINAYLSKASFNGITETLRFQPDGNISGGTVYISEVKQGKVVAVGTSAG
ncbi:MAG: branched-chain amino acid ABC transporter substrate-binding protein [Acidimicrobiales bacterium]